MSQETIERTLISVPATKAGPQAGRLRFDRGRFQTVPADALDRKARTQLFGLPLTNSTIEQAAQAIVTRAASGQRSVIQFVNAHCVNTLFKVPEYGRALSQADDLLPDGSGVTLAARIAGKRINENLNGTDLFPHLCREAAAQNQKIFLLGGMPGVALTVRDRMQQAVPGLQIAGTEHGYFCAESEAAIIRRINASGADILLVGLGVPAQEIWIARNRAKIDIPVLLGVGGLFDYYSGRLSRAPLLFRTMGMEWVWRLMLEPRRLAHRYIVGNAVFMAHALRHGAQSRAITEDASLTLKRGLDVVLAVVAMLLLAPLMLFVAALIKIEDRGPVFFRQTRIGENGKPFLLWKFRSMGIDAEARRHDLLDSSERDSVCFKMKRDPRITSVGRWIRRLSIDELPQIFNVLSGTMSLVGPRPALPQEVSVYGAKERERLGGQPGITGSWQVSGRAEIEFAQQVEMDIEYLKSRSFIYDLQVIARTVPAVISGHGAY